MGCQLPILESENAGHSLDVLAVAAASVFEESNITFEDRVTEKALVNMYRKHICIVSWNLHRLSTLHAIDIVKRVFRETSCHVFLVQEAGCWNGALFEKRTGLRCISHKSGDRDVAVILSPNINRTLVWTDFCRFAIAVFILVEPQVFKSHLFVSMHLPDSWQSSVDEYADALTVVEEMMRRLPCKYKVVSTTVGCDANTELVGGDGLEEWIGSRVSGTMCHERAWFLVDFLQTWKLQAINTKTNILRLLAKVHSMDQIFTHRMYSTGRLRQIDYIFSSCSEFASTCLEGFREEASSDHWPLLALCRPCEGVRIRAHAGRTSRKGWQVHDEQGARHYNEVFCSSVGSGTLQDLQSALKKAGASTLASSTRSRTLKEKAPAPLLQQREKVCILVASGSRKASRRTEALPHA